MFVWVETNFNINRISISIFSASMVCWRCYYCESNNNDTRGWSFESKTNITRWCWVVNRKHPSNCRRRDLFNVIQRWLLSYLALAATIRCERTQSPLRDTYSYMYVSACRSPASKQTTTTGSPEDCSGAMAVTTNNSKYCNTTGCQSSSSSLLP